jgi:hypothetical protein
MEYSPAFRRYTPECADLLSRIRAARAIIETLPIPPAQEDELRKEALVGTIHYSTLIEGNTLGLVEALQVLTSTRSRRPSWSWSTTSRR